MNTACADTGRTESSCKSILAKRMPPTRVVIVNSPSSPTMSGSTPNATLKSWRTFRDSGVSGWPEPVPLPACNTCKQLRRECQVSNKQTTAGSKLLPAMPANACLQYFAEVLVFGHVAYRSWFVAVRDRPLHTVPSAQHFHGELAFTRASSHWC